MHSLHYCQDIKTNQKNGVNVCAPHACTMCTKGCINASIPCSAITCTQLLADFSVGSKSLNEIQRSLCPPVSWARRTICTDVHVQNKACAGGRGQDTDRLLPSLSGPISVWQVNGEHKTHLKATFTTWLIPLHCVISRCHISPPHVCLNALPSTLWLVSLDWLPQIHSSRAPHPFTSSLQDVNGCIFAKLFSALFL